MSSSDSDSNSSNRSRGRRLNRRRRQHQAAAGAPDHPPVRIPDHPLITADAPQWIDTPDALADLFDHVRSVGCFAYDTEFIGELSYHPKLCLIQIATPQRVAVVDALVGIDFTGLWELLADPDIRVLVHAGGQDLEPVVRHLDRNPANVLDTQVAAGFVGLPYPAALSKLIEQMLGVRIGKGLTFTSWDERPISEAHLRYAGDDVRFLPALAAALDEQLAAGGHGQWAMTECAALCDKAAYGFDPLRQLGRVRSAKSLSAKSKSVLMSLLSVRDEGAREHDLPPRTFLADEVLVEMARRPVRSRQRLAEIRNMPRPVAAEYGQRFIDAIEHGAARDRNDWPAAGDAPETLDERIRVDALWAAMQSYCMAHRVDPSLVTNRSEISRAYFTVQRGGKIDGRLGSSWRREMLGDFIERFIAGDASMTLRWLDGRLALGE